MTNCAGSSDHKTISTASPATSFLTAVTRVPRTPTQVPIGSIRLSYVTTAIFARIPGSRAAPLISSNPCSISGTSFSNNLIKKSGQVRDSSICGPRASRSTFKIYARTRSPERRFSLGIIWSRRNKASTRPDSIIKPFLSARFTVPVITFSPRSR